MRTRKEYKGYVVVILILILITVIVLFSTGNINLGNKITEKDYKCPTGYILKDEKCKKDVFECPAGTLLISTGQCVKTTITYNCPDGYELYDETKCVNKEEAEYVYVCPTGYELYNETKCKKDDKIIDAVKILKDEAIFEYICPTGYELYNETKCKKGNEIIDATKEQKTDNNYKYVCPEGYEIYNGTKCKKGNEIIDAIKKQNSKNNNIKDANEKLKDEILDKEKITNVVDPIKKNEKFTVNSINVLSDRNSYSMSHDLNNDRDNIRIKILPENITTTVICNSSDEEIIKLAKNSYTITGSGLLSVLGIGPGTATITCSTSNEKKASFTITICPDELYMNGACNG